MVNEAMNEVEKLRLRLSQLEEAEGQVYASVTAPTTMRGLAERFTTIPPDLRVRKP